MDFFKPRLYQDSADLQAMKYLLSQGILAGGPGHYVHPGDIQWWLFYPPFGVDLIAHTWVWDDPAQSGELLAWMLVDPSWPSFELFVASELFGSDLHRQMLLWAEAEAQRLCPPEAQTLNKLWIAEGDVFQRSHLESRSFVETAADTFFLRSLAEPLPTAAAPGWTVRRCRGVSEAPARARSQYGAFASSKPFDQYVERFVRFMQSEAYTGALDVVAANTAGEIGSFCIAWLDAQTHRGHLEPVGTHPDFQRLGLGRAVILAALHLLQARGMTYVSVCTPDDNAPAQGLYTSLGFKGVERLSTYKKRIAHQ
jgi:ribosomal protein S18 acetylase RimI-like enzyme